MKLNKFLSSKRQGYVTVAGIEPVIVVGNPVENAHRHSALMHSAASKGAEIICGPELGGAGYTLFQLWSDHLLRQKARAGLKLFLDLTADINAILLYGTGLVFDNVLVNCEVVSHKGRIKAIIVKKHLPVSGQFRESDRSGTSDHLKKKYYKIFDEVVPVGSGEDIMVEVDQGESLPQLRIGFWICEDGWQKVTPAAIAAMNGANIIVGMATSNEQVGKPEWREVLARAESGMGVSVGYMMVSSGWGEDTTDLTFGGQMIFAERGNITRNVEPFALEDLAPEERYVMHQFDMWAIEHDNQVFSYLESARPYHRDMIRVEINAVLGVDDETVYHTLYAPVDPYPFVPQDEQERKKRSNYVRRIQRRGLVTRVQALLAIRQRNHPNEHRLPLLMGISGGVDSALALLIAANTYQFLGLPLTDIIAVTMPGFGTTDTKQDALGLARELGVTALEIPIGSDADYGPVISVFDAVGFDWRDTQNEGLPFENGQAMIRTLILYVLANMYEGFVLGTGDWSEGKIAWLTKYGDGAYDYGVNGGLAKTLVQFIVQTFSDNDFANNPRIRAILHKIVHVTPVSPELKRARANVIVQETDGVNGPVTLRDCLAYYQERFGLPPSRLAFIAMHAFSKENNPLEVYDLPTIKHWLMKYVPRAMGGAQHKLDVVPPNPKVGLSNSGRYEHQWPATLNPVIWMENVAEIPDLG